MLLAGWLGRRRGGAAGKTRRSAAELAEDESERNGRLWWSGCHVWGSGWLRGGLRASSKLTGRTVDGVRSPPGRTRGGGRRLSKTESMIQSPASVTETRSSTTFYSQLKRWFWLEFDPFDRATRVLQVCLQDQSLTCSGFQSTRLPQPYLETVWFKT